MRCGLGVLAAVAATGLCVGITALFAGTPGEGGDAPPPPMKSAESLSVAEARGRARLLQRTYETTLQTIHRRYFDADEKDAIPAKALEDVFEEADAGTGRTTRWIAVNTPPMNVDHTPGEGFEKRAAEALSAGVTEFEAVDDGVYHRAGAVRLGASCLKCHLSALTKQVTTPRVAAIVISIPVEAQ